jgi:MoxR-like ATPase
MQVTQANQYANEILRELKRIIVGQDQVIQQVVTALLAGGHILLEGVPGTAKTLLAKCLAYITGTEFHRVQFTPDLMPADILGVNIYDTAHQKFFLQKGPVFTDILLADEINRAPAKTQAALLEAMEEDQVTIDGVSHPMSQVFLVIATQNPVEYEGTYSLPEAQLDRFMMKVVIDYPPEEKEAEILDKIENGFDSSHLEKASIQKLLELNSLVSLRQTVRQIRCEEMVRRYVTQVIRATRSGDGISLGASPRAGVMLLLAAKANAVVEGRDFVTPDDEKFAAIPVLRHRIMLAAEAEVEGVSADVRLNGILLKTEVPR